MAEPLLVRAFWDDEAQVWVAESDDVPGLVAEAATLEELLRELDVLVPELLALNAPEKLADDLTLRVVAERTRLLHRAA